MAHPPSYAVEDYVDPALLMATINALRSDAKASTPISIKGLPAGETIGQRIDKWFASRRVKGPGKVAIATRLANMGPDLKLSPGAKQKLESLHAEITAALASRAET